MQGKTHLVVGITSALLIMRPDTLAELTLGIAAAAVGSIISDIDVTTSFSHKKADRIVSGCILAIIGLAALEFFEKVSVWNQISGNSLLVNKIVGFIILLIICAFGKEQSHRSFMHSLLALAAFGWCMKILLQSTYMYFCIAFLSHIVLDLCNRKGIQLFYPYKNRYCLRLCSSGGKVDGWIGKAGMMAMIAVIGWRLFNMK